MARTNYLLLCVAALLVLMSMADAPVYAAGKRVSGNSVLVEAIALPGAHGLGSVYRIFYRSRTSRNAPVVVSGLALVPDGPMPVSGRPVVSWGHGTVGVATNCAPSLNLATAIAAIPGLTQLLKKGFVVVAADYPGLGSPGVHPYLDGVSSARSMIDAVRAVRELPQAHAGSRYAAWGFSQGGHGALYVASIAKSYAPELTLVGSAAASAPTQLRRLLRADANTLAGRVIASYAIWSWQRFYRAPAAEIADERAMSIIDGISRICSLDMLDDLELGLDSMAFQNGSFLKSEPALSTIWGRLIALNSAPQTPRDIPILVLQGGLDQIVEPPITRAYVKKLCLAGRRVTYVEMPAADHGGVALQGAGTAVRWVEDRFSGQPIATNCD